MSKVLETLLERQLQKLMETTSEEELLAAMREKSPRQVMGEFLLALSQLCIYHGVQAQMEDVSVNFHGGAMRVDIATLTADKQHLEAWVLGVNANVLDEQFGARVPLPGSDGPMQ